MRPLGVARALWRSTSHSVSCFCLEVDGPGKMKVYQGAALKSKPEILDIHLFFFFNETLKITSTEQWGQTQRAVVWEAVGGVGAAKARS